MAVLQQAVRYGGPRVTRRLARSIPWIGTALAVVTIGDAIRRKGLFCGTLDCTLNAVPFVGAIKNMAEMVRGRDFLPDRRVTAPLPGARHQPGSATPSTPQATAL